MNPRHVLTALAMVACALGPQAQARELRIGIYSNPPKLEAGPGGEPAGILGDLAREIARREDWTLVPVACEWEACLAMLEAGQLDLMPDVALSAERERRFSFHRVPVLHSWSQLYASPGFPVQSMVELHGGRVAVLSGSVQEAYLTDLARGFGIALELVPASSFDETFAAVAGGRADAAAVNHHYGNREARAAGLVETPIMFLPSELYFAAPPGRHADVLARIDHWLRQWRADPSSPWYEILRRWGAAPEEGRLPTWVPRALVAVLGLLALAVCAVVLLRREVARRTASLRASEERLAAILDSVDAYIFIKDREGRYSYINRKAAEMLGRAPESVVGRSDDELFDAATARRIAADDRRVLDHGERVAAEETLAFTDGRAEVLAYSVKLPLRDRHGGVHALCGISTDLTEERRLHAELQSIALFDPLTRLPNRRHLLEELEAALEACAGGVRSGALLMVDVARFKELNDTLGHDLGDRLLRAVADRIGPVLPQGAVLARMGADEFAVLLAGMPGAASDARQAAGRVAQLLVESLSAPFLLGGERYPCRVHMGIAVFSGLQDRAQDVLRQADLALSEAKAEGAEGPRFFRPELASLAVARASLEKDLREGIEARQFELHFQPQVGHGGRAFGVEALVRWEHPKRGRVSPASFIPLAEASGLILPLGRWIFRSACEQLVSLSRREATADLVMSVNISARQMHGPRFVDEVLETIRATGAPPRQIELELTESLLLEDMEGAIGKMRRLKEAGLRLALDDFGTGYSSLGYLKRLPLDQLKIDVVFVRDLLVDPNDLAIVRTIIGLGRSLDLSVLAEGVETEAQRDLLAELGCHRYQGYLFSPPRPMAELKGWLDQHADVPARS